MNEYRKDVPLSQESEYWFVEMGPLPGKPEWHMKMYAHQSYPFPRLEAARLFAANHREPGREIAIRFPDVTREAV